MSSGQSTTGLMSDQLSQPTSVFGLRLWVVFGVCIGTGFVLLLLLITLYLASKHSKCNTNTSSNKAKKISRKISRIPSVCKEIREIRINHQPMNQNPLPHQQETRVSAGKIEGKALLLMPPEEECGTIGYRGIQIDINGKGNNRISFPGSSGEAAPPRPSCGGGNNQVAMVVPDVSH